MTTIFGREGELGRISRVLDSAQSNHLVRAIRILGPSGVGKTALATAGAEDARDRGWLVASAQCFRIHGSLPLFLARRLTRSVIEALGDRAETYRSGLDLDSDKPERFEEAFYRLIEAVALDFPLALFVDDAQWADAESRDLLLRTVTTLADRPIVLFSAERNDETPEPAFALQDEALVLGELPKRAAEQIVRSIFPAANEDVVASVIASAGTRAVDLVAVAEAAREADASTSKAVNASTRTVIARDLALLDAPLRSFLQICALVEEPIDFGLLRMMWPQDELLNYIGKASGRYLVEDEGELRFVHAAIMEAVHETIPIEIPYRYRIIEALKSLPSPRLEDYERLAQQAVATRDASLERESLLKLAQSAASKSLLTLAADAMERALRIAPPLPSEIVPFFTQLSQFYNVLGRERDCIRICQEGLALASESEISEGAGSIAASLLLALWNLGHYTEAREEYQRCLSRHTADSDRAQLLTVGLLMDMHVGEFDDATRTAGEFEAIRSAANPFVLLRYHAAQAFIALRRADEARALEHVVHAEQIAKPLPPIAMTMPRNIRMIHAMHFLGMPAAEQLATRRENELNETLAEVLASSTYLGRGQFNDLHEFVAEKLLRRRDGTARRQFLTSFAVAAAFDETLTRTPLWAAVAEEAAHFTAGEHAASLLPLAAAWLAAIGPAAGASASKMLDELVRAHGHAFDYQIFTYPITLVIASKRLASRDQLQRLAETTTIWTDAHPMGQAQSLLSRAAALTALRDRNAGSLAHASAQRFEALGMPFFARYATQLEQPSGDTAVGVTTPNKTTRREREVAALVAEGLTNREIAERLVLSERTVEGHIANLFAKVNVGSRTQLAAWYLKAMNSVAS